MKFILTLLIVTFFNFGTSQVSLEDDVLHFGVGAIIAGTSYEIVYSMTKNKKKAFWYSLGLSSLAGLSKEIYDGYIISGKFDTSEFVSTTLGGFTASYTFNIFTGKRKKKKIDKKLLVLRL